MHRAVRHYVLAYLSLMGLLLLTVGVFKLQWGIVSTVMSLFIAATKALLIIAVFMRAREGPPVIRLAAGVGFFWLILLFGLMAADYTTRIWLWHQP